MSDCHKVEKNIEGYLEDLLPENERAEIRRHLTHCGNCSVFLRQVGSFTGDLRHSAFAPLPPGQLETLLREVERRETFPWKRFIHFSKILLIAALSAGIIWFAFRGVRAWENHLREEKQRLLQEQLAGSLVIEQLKNIEKRLSRYGSKNGRAEDGREKTQEAAPQSVISLHPFHWHLDFDSASSRDDYLEKLREAGVKFLYLSKETPVIEFAYEKFSNLVHETAAFPGLLTKESLVDLERLPVSEKPVKVSFYFHYPNRQNKPHHWHLKFSLSNRFLFEGEARREFKLLFEDQDLWILNVNSDEFIHLIQMVQGVQGVEADWGEQGQNPKQPDVRVPVMITFSGG